MRGSSMNQQPTQTTVYIGLNDSETGVQKFESQKYVSVLKNVCRMYKVAFSVQEIKGGYFHEDGRYTEENSLKLTLMDVPEQTCVPFSIRKVLWSPSPRQRWFL